MQEKTYESSKSECQQEEIKGLMHLESQDNTHREVCAKVEKVSHQGIRELLMIFLRKAYHPTRKSE